MTGDNFISILLCTRTILIDVFFRFFKLKSILVRMMAELGAFDMVDTILEKMTSLYISLLGVSVEKFIGLD